MLWPISIGPKLESPLTFHFTVQVKDNKCVEASEHVFNYVVLMQQQN